MTAVPNDATPPIDLGDPAEAAERYASLGWQVIPIGPGKKYPEGLGRWQDAATDDLDTIRNWYSGLYRGHGVGIATGPDTGVWVLDVDIAAGKQGAQSLAELNAEHGQLPATVTATTGTGGLHLFFTWDPTQPPITNGMATRLPPGLDVRGQGGQVVAAPTLHPDTGTAYAWRPDRHPFTAQGGIAVADAPDWLYQLLTADQAPVEVTAPNIQRPAVASTDDSIAEWIRDTHDWATVLEHDGWTHHSTHGDDTWWTRPGKNRADGHSAVLHGTDGPLVVFTTEIDPAMATAGSPTADGSGISLSMFGYIAGTRHNGDRSTTAREARLERRRLEDPAGIAPAANGPVTGLLGPTPAQLPQLPAGPDSFTDLGTWWDNPEPTLTPDLLTRTDGLGLFYRGQLNWVHGDSGSGKTWIVLEGMRRLLAAGEHVVWVHYEDPSPANIVGRLKLLGADRGAVLERFHYWDPQGEHLNTGLLLDACHDLTVTGLALDSVGEALNSVGLNEDSDAEVGPWITRGPRAIANHGIGVICIDHLPKDTKHPLHPSGSKRKRAAITGAGHQIKAEIPPTRTSDGRMAIICGKDRHGNHAQGQTIGMAHLRHSITTGGIELTITGPTGEDDSETEKRIREVERIVATDPGLSRNQLLNLMSSASKRRKNDAIDAAIRTGVVRVETGPRNAQEFHPDD